MKGTRRPLLATTVLLAGLALSPALRSAPPAVPAVAPTAPAASAATSTTAATTAAGAIEEVSRTAHHPSLRWPEFPWYQDKMAALYGPRGGAPLWLASGRPSKQAADVVALLEDAASRGLPPSDYDAEWLRATLDALAPGRGPLSDREAGLFDAALTLLYMRHISDVHIGRINPSHLGYEGYDPDPRKYDLVQLVQAAIAEDRVAQTVAAAEPQFPQYGWLKEALARYRRLESAGPPGAHDPAAPKVLLSKRVRQLELAMERYRWLPEPDPKARFLVVNVPAFELFALDWSKGVSEAVLKMRVVVGKAVSTQTPLFTGKMRFVVFRPYWYLPQSIVRGEVLPGIRKDPRYLARHDMEVTSGGNDSAPALPATPENMKKVAAGTLGLRQRPGPKNSLGPAKFIFPNHASIYLHGTPAKALFARERRDFSHGCIRVEDPVALAQFVLDGRPEGSRERILAAMGGTRPVRVDLSSPLPVLVFYTTAIAGPGGEVRFFQDLYGHDAKLEGKLLAGEPYEP